MTVRIGLTGDVMLGRLVDQHQRRRDATEVWGDLLDHLRGLDGLLINLECCLSTRGRRWRRTSRTFHFRADPEWAIPALRHAGVDCCGLANNHVLDYEEVALQDTLDHLDDGDVAHAGAGRTRQEAFEPALVQVDHLDVAFLSFTDNTPEYAADDETPGTARIEIDVDDEETRRLVGESLGRARANDPDLVVASLHWGPNMVAEPPASFRVFGRWLVDEGVDVIHGHSAHVFQGVEVYRGAPICYDTGDFVDDYRVEPELRNDRSFLFEVAATDGGLKELRLLPVEIDDCAVYRADGETASWCRERMRRRSDDFGTSFQTDAEELVVSLA